MSVRILAANPVSVHVSAPDIAGKNLANSMALILSGAMTASRTRPAALGSPRWWSIHGVLREGQKLTRDLGGVAGTAALAEAIASRV